jgi:hypothetical protein
MVSTPGKNPIMSFKVVSLFRVRSFHRLSAGIKGLFKLFLVSCSVFPFFEYLLTISFRYFNQEAVEVCSTSIQVKQKSDTVDNLHGYINAM